jgi:hypothetical protein
MCMFAYKGQQSLYIYNSCKDVTKFFSTKRCRKPQKEKKCCFKIAYTKFVLQMIIEMYVPLTKVTTCKNSLYLTEPLSN